MMLEGFSRRLSTNRSRICPSLSRPATPSSPGPTSPCNLASAAGITWHMGQLPRSRLKAVSRPRAASPPLPVNDWGMASPTTVTCPSPSTALAGSPWKAPATSAMAIASTRGPSLTSGLLQLHVLKGQRAHRRARRRICRVQNGRGPEADGRLPDATPEPAGRHDDALDLRVVLHQHHRIAVEIFLHHSAVTDGAFLVSHGAKTESHRALGLHGHLLGIDRVAAVDGDHQSMDLELAAVADGYLGGTRAVAGIAHELRNAAMDASCRRRVPANAVRHGIEHGKVLWTTCQQLATQLQWVLAGRASHFVDERLEPDRVLVRVDAPPEANGNVGIAYGVLDEEVRDGVAKARLRPSRIKTLKRGRVPSVAIKAIRRSARQDGGSRNAHVQPDETTLVVEAG